MLAVQRQKRPIHTVCFSQLYHYFTSGPQDPLTIGQVDTPNGPPLEKTQNIDLRKGGRKLPKRSRCIILLFLRSS